MTKIFRSNITAIEKATYPLSIPATMSGSNVILGKENKERLRKAYDLLIEAIKTLNEIE